MKKGKTISLIFLLVILFSASTIAQPFRGIWAREGFKMHSPVRILYLLKANQKELNISDEQLKKIKELVYSCEEKMIQMKNENSAQRLQLRKLIEDNEELDYPKIKEVLSKISVNMEDIFIQRLKLKEEIEKILTPQQREALRSKILDKLKERAPFPKERRWRHFSGLRRLT